MDTCRTTLVYNCVENAISLQIFIRISIIEINPREVLKSNENCIYNRRFGWHYLLSIA